MGVPNRLPFLPTNMSDYNTPELNAALVAAIAETKDVHADSTNPFHRSKYASLGAHLSALKGIFAKHGLAIVQFPIAYGGEHTVGVKTIVMHKSGQSLGFDCALTAPVKKNEDGKVIEQGYTAQQAGATISYLRRYALASVAGVATDDDDAETDRVVHAKTAPVVNYIPNTGATPAQQGAPTASGDIDPTIVVPFGRSKGQAIGTLGVEDLKYWATTWEPRPYEKTGKVTKKDATLKATAVALYAKASSSEQQQDEVDEVPF